MYLKKKSSNFKKYFNRQLKKENNKERKLKSY